MTVIGLFGGNTDTYLFVIWYCIVMILIICSFFLTFRMNKKPYNIFCALCHNGCTRHNLEMAKLEVQEAIAKKAKIVISGDQGDALINSILDKELLTSDISLSYK